MLLGARCMDGCSFAFGPAVLLLCGSCENVLPDAASQLRSSMRAAAASLCVADLAVHCSSNILAWLLGRLAAAVCQLRVRQAGRQLLKILQTMGGLQHLWMVCDVDVAGCSGVQLPPSVQCCRLNL